MPNWTMATFRSGADECGNSCTFIVVVVVVAAVVATSGDYADNARAVVLLVRRSAAAAVLARCSLVHSSTRPLRSGTGRVPYHRAGVVTTQTTTVVARVAKGQRTNDAPPTQTVGRLIQAVNMPSLALSFGC